MTQTTPSWTIGELASRCGVAPSTLRFYEELGLLDPHARRGGQRRYQPSSLRVVSFIRLAQRAGFKLEEIKTLLHGFPKGTPHVERWEALARQKLRDVEAQARQLLEVRRLLIEGIACGCGHVHPEDMSGDVCAMIRDLPDSNVY